MRSPASPSIVLALSIVASVLTAGALASCSGKGKGSGLSYAQVQTIQPGLSATQIRDSFGPPMSAARGPDGRVTRMEYAAKDAKRSGSRLILDFDARELLVTKTYTGEVVRPR